MTQRVNSQRRQLVVGGAAVTAAGMLPVAAQAQNKGPVKVAVIVPMTGPFASTGRQVSAAVRLYQKVHGDTAGGRKVEVTFKDDVNKPDDTKRIAQEFLTRENGDIIAGFGLTPLALAAAPLATQSKKLMLVMAAATSIITQRSPYIVRSNFTVPQTTAPLASWAFKNGIKTVVTQVADYAPGIDAEKVFTKHFAAAGGKVLESIRTPQSTDDYGPFMQRVKDMKPDAMFVFVPSGEGIKVMKQFAERGMKQAGIQLIGPGDLLDDDFLADIGPVAEGVVTSQHYSAAHPSALNKAYVEGMKRDNNGMRANFMSVGGYDGMHLIYEALKKTNGDADGDKLIAAMKGMSWESVRGPVTLDPETRDMIQDIYIRRATMVNGELWNIEFDKIPQFKDPGSA